MKSIWSFALAVVLASLLSGRIAHAANLRVVQVNKTFVADSSDEEATEMQKDAKKRETKKVDVIEAKLGDKITFANRDVVTHNINGAVAGDQTFDIGAQPPGAATDRVIDLTKKGEIEVRCAIHPKMRLKIKVD